MVFAPLDCLSSGLSRHRPSLPENSVDFGIRPNRRHAENAVPTTILRLHVTHNAASTANGPATARSSASYLPYVACLSDSHETTSCPFIYYSSNVTGAKPTTPAEKSYSSAAQSGKIAAEARKAEEDNSAKHEEAERARRADRVRKEKEKEQREKERKERERKERKEREERDRARREKERERRDRERDRKEREYDDKEREDRRERDKKKSVKYSERRYKDDDGYQREERSDRDKDRYRPSRDRSSHRHDESHNSGSDSEEGWTRVSYRKSKSY